jgi:hypothetical protein
MLEVHRKEGGAEDENSRKMSEDFFVFKYLEVRSKASPLTARKCCI